MKISAIVPVNEVIKNDYLCRTDSRRWPLGEKGTEHPFCSTFVQVIYLFRKWLISENVILEFIK